MEPVAETIPELRRRPSRLSVRWTIALSLCAAITISYFDRQTLSVARSAIEKQIKIEDKDFAHLNTAFLLTYGMMYVIGGKLMDLLGTRVGFFVIMVGWSLACASHGLATSFGILAVCRLLLGLGEGGGFPAATKAVAEWFPVRERATAMGLINGGTALGGILAAPAIAWILLHLPWPWVFYISGALGLLWSLWWLAFYRTPDKHRMLSTPERALMGDDTVAATDEAGVKISWLKLFTYVEVWGLVIAKFMTDAAWYFISFWLPSYLQQARHYNIKDVGMFAWIPWAAAGVGCIVVGSFSSFLVKRGYSLNLGRKVAMGVSVSVMPCLFFVPFVPTAWVIVPFAIAYFGQQAWSTLVMTLPADMFPRRAVGAVAGLVGFGGAMGGIVFGEIVGAMRGNGIGWGPVFAIAGTLHVLAFLLLLVMVRKVQSVARK